MWFIFKAFFKTFERLLLPGIYSFKSPAFPCFFCQSMIVGSFVEISKVVVEASLCFFSTYLFLSSKRRVSGWR